MKEKKPTFDKLFSWKTKSFFFHWKFIGTKSFFFGRNVSLLGTFWSTQSKLNEAVPNTLTTLPPNRSCLAWNTKKEDKLKQKIRKKHWYQCLNAKVMQYCSCCFYWITIQYWNVHKRTLLFHSALNSRCILMASNVCLLIKENQSLNMGSFNVHSMHRICFCYWEKNIKKHKKYAKLSQFVAFVAKFSLKNCCFPTLAND